MANRTINKIGIVYSGGLARGSAQLAFANEIIKKIGYERISVISASSVGSLNAYATGTKRIDQMLECYKDLDFASVRDFISGVRSNQFNLVFNKIEGGDFICPVYVSGTKIFSFECHYFCLNGMTRTDIKNVINVSMAFPIINGPLRFNRLLYIDGGATDNIPVYPLNYFDVDMIIILHCYPKYYPPIELYNLKPNTVIVDVDVTLSLDKKLTSFSLTKPDFLTMLSAGEEEGKRFADFIFSDFDFKEVRKRCYKYTNDNLHTRFLKNSDGLMSLVDLLNTLYQFKSSLSE